MPLNYEIRRDRHAIGEFTANLKLAAPISPARFSDVVVELKRIAQQLDLPAPLNIQVFNLAIGGGAGVPPFQGAPGAGYQRFSSAGEVACALLCDNESMTLTLREYEGWGNVLPLIVSTFSDLIKIYVTEVPVVRAMSVQYLNEFRGKDASVNNVAELLRAGTRWVAPFAFEGSNAWHCHTGQFLPFGESCRYLVNVNCDIAPAILPGEFDEKQYVKILILSAASFDTITGPLNLGQGDVESIIGSVFDKIHDIEKSVLREVVTIEYLEAMGDVV